MSGQPNKIERQAYRWLMKMLDDPGRHAAALERWLSKDTEHRAVYKRVAIEVGRASDSAVHLPSLRSDATMRSEPFGWASRSRMVVVGGVIVMSVAVIGILGTHHAFWSGPAPWENHRSESRSYEASAEDNNLKLPDGSAVTLFAGSRIVTRFTEGERAVDLLRGRARFAVSHNPARPFVVYAAGGKVTATGTLFEVAISRGVNVRLISGSVVVSLPQAAKQRPANIVRLMPGQQVSYSAPETASQVAAGPLASDASQRLESFDDVPAAEIAEKVNRSSAIKIVFSDPALGSRRIVADLDIQDPQAVAQKLALVLGLVVDRSRPDRLLLELAK